jgi:hypothetical protein
MIQSYYDKETKSYKYKDDDEYDVIETRTNKDDTVETVRIKKLKGIHFLNL